MPATLIIHNYNTSLSQSQRHYKSTATHGWSVPPPGRSKRNRCRIMKEVKWKFKWNKNVVAFSLIITNRLVSTIEYRTPELRRVVAATGDLPAPPPCVPRMSLLSIVQHTKRPKRNCLPVPKSNTNTNRFWPAGHSTRAGAIDVSGAK